MTQVNISIELSDLLSDDDRKDAVTNALIRAFTSYQENASYFIFKMLVSEIMEEFKPQLLEAVRKQVDKNINCENSYSGIAWHIEQSSAYKKTIEEGVNLSKEATLAKVMQMDSDRIVDKVIEGLQYHIGDEILNAMAEMRNKA